MPETDLILPEKFGKEHSKQALRLWIRLLTCSSEVEKLVRKGLINEFGSTLPRFDILSALDRNPEGLGMGQLSELLMVSNGNVTGLIDRLVHEDLVRRETVEHDRRASKITLTPAGARAFKAMARAHEDWIDDMFAQLGDQEIEQLLTLLNRLRASVAKRSLPRG
jgi:DNA-binding MarR family transcriptional regulator